MLAARLSLPSESGSVAGAPSNKRLEQVAREVVVLCVGAQLKRTTQGLIDYAQTGDSNHAFIKPYLLELQWNRTHFEGRRLYGVRRIGYGIE